MTHSHTNTDDLPCSCGANEAYTDSLCPGCEEAEQIERELAEEAREIGNALRARDNQHFADACSSMTREDWDADNDWLASAGWGEM